MIQIVGLSCRKNATIEDPRLPGGIVLGKIVGYEMTGNGDDGEFLGKVTINSAVGNGARCGHAGHRGSTARDEGGTPVYVESGYVDLGYQHYEGQPGRGCHRRHGDSPCSSKPSGFQLPITEDQVLVRHEYHDAGCVYDQAEVARCCKRETGAAQSAFHHGPAHRHDDHRAASAGAGITQARQRRSWTWRSHKYADDNPSWVEMEFKPVQDVSTEVEYDADVHRAGDTQADRSLRTISR